jgi:hypothetical protein
MRYYSADSPFLAIRGCAGGRRGDLSATVSTVQQCLSRDACSTSVFLSRKPCDEYSTSPAKCRMTNPSLLCTRVPREYRWYKVVQMVVQGGTGY